MLRIRLFDVPFNDAMRRARNLPRAAHGMSMAHLGVAVLMFGFIGSSAWKSEEVVFVKPGSSISIAGFDVSFQGVNRFVVQTTLLIAGCSWLSEVVSTSLPCIQNVETIR